MTKKHVNLSFRHVNYGDLAPLAMQIVAAMAANVAIFVAPVLLAQVMFFIGIW